MKLVRKKGVPEIKITHNKKLFWTIIFLLFLLGVFLYYANKQFEIGDDEDKNVGNECVSNDQCVPEICCHASSCVSKNLAPDCSNMMCTTECVPGTMDCGQGSCECVNGNCQAVFVDG
jgi:hypothetical protein